MTPTLKEQRANRRSTQVKELAEVLYLQLTPHERAEVKQKCCHDCSLINIIDDLSRLCKTDLKNLYFKHDILGDF